MLFQAFGISTEERIAAFQVVNICIHTLHASLTQLNIPNIPRCMVKLLLYHHTLHDLPLLLLPLLYQFQRCGKVAVNIITVNLYHPITNYFDISMNMYIAVVVFSYNANSFRRQRSSLRDDAVDLHTLHRVTMQLVCRRNTQKQSGARVCATTPGLRNCLQGLYTCRTASSHNNTDRVCDVQ